jgi:hypothetical protein
MKTIYIAGPMRGIPLYNFPAFDAAHAKLQLDLGYKVINPAQLDRQAGFDPAIDLPADWDWHTLPDHFSLADAMRRDFEAIMQSDELCLLPGWQLSRGATAEKALAEWRGLRVWELEPETILQEAQRITGGDRQASYGPPDQDFRRTADAWRALFGWDVEPWQVAGAMIALKLSRQSHQKKRDNWTDISGYSRCGSLCDGTGT